MTKVVGTGTRDIVKVPDAMEYVVTHLTQLLIQGKELHPDLSVGSGMAEGFDEALALAAMGADVPWDAYVPGPGYGQYYWGQHSQTGRNREETFRHMLGQARSVIYTCNDKRLYVQDDRSGAMKSEHINFIRNYDMIDASARVWTYYNTLKGGTRHGLAYAKKLGKPIYRVPIFQTR